MRKTELPSLHEGLHLVLKLVRPERGRAHLKITTRSLSVGDARGPRPHPPACLGPRAVGMAEPQSPGTRSSTSIHIQALRVRALLRSFSGFGDFLRYSLSQNSLTLEPLL